MSTESFIDIQPAELKFPFELKKQCTTFMRLTNKTDRYVAFKVLTTNPKKYCVRPNIEFVLPGTSCEVTVTMQAQREAPPDMQCKDKFLVQSVLAPEGASKKDITSEMFKDTGRLVQEFKLRVICIPANLPSPVPEGSGEVTPPRASTPSPVPEGSEEVTPPRASTPSNGNESVSFEDVSRSLEKTKEKSSEISILTEQIAAAWQQNERLLQELEAFRRENRKYRLVLIAVVCLLLIGYLITHPCWVCIGGLRSYTRQNRRLLRS